MAREGEWMTLDQLQSGDLFEVQGSGRCGVVTGRLSLPDDGEGTFVMAVLVGGGNTVMFRASLPARRLDLPFLLAAANDKLARQEWYNRGHRDGSMDAGQRLVKLVLEKAPYVGNYAAEVLTQAAEQMGKEVLG